jgi:23S rRNA (adenine2503-C2)-methyltransferase
MESSEAGLELEGLSPDELAARVEGTGRAGAVWRVLGQGGDAYHDDGLSATLRRLLRERTRPAELSVEARAVSHCGTRKLRLRLNGGERIETVLIPKGVRTTVCVSTQVGCARGCVFCLTATMGLRRGLSPGEIVGQVTRAIAEARGAGLPPVRNVVFMGMGEPLDNLDAVRQSLAVLCHPRALGLGPSHVTLSTVGTSPKAIGATRDLKVQLAWSLHAVDEALRRRLVPTARYSPRELRTAFIERLVAPETLFVEMTLIDGVNDRIDQADELAAFLEPFLPGVRVNLLPMNPGRADLASSPQDRLLAFRQRLRDRGFFCTARKPRGVEVAAACGQLAVEGPWLSGTRDGR